MRADQIREAFTEALGDRVVFSMHRPNDAGIFWGTNRRLELDVVVVHPVQLAAMSEALADDTFSAFVPLLVQFATLVLSFLADELDLDAAMEAAQHLMAEQEPAGYMLLDSVFFE